jgi:hypothetical protein
VKLFIINYKAAHKRIIKCINLAELRNIGKCLYKARHERKEKISKIQITFLGIVHRPNYLLKTQLDSSDAD